MPTIWINERLQDDDAPAVPARDAGLLHGLGVFTTMSVERGNVFRLPMHLARVRASCQALHLPLPYDDARLIAAVGEVIDANAETPNLRLRLTVTGGQPTPGGQVPTVLLTALPVGDEVADLRRTGTRVTLVSDHKLNPYDPTAGHKCLDYVARFGALREAARHSCGEALWFNVHNYLQSGSVSNVFLVKDGRLLTPPTQADLADPANAEGCPYPRSNVLPGVVRHAVLESAAKLGIDTATPAIDVDTLLAADEVFVTNSLMRVLPVTHREAEPVGTGSVGEVTKRLAEAVDALHDA